MAATDRVEDPVFRCQLASQICEIEAVRHALADWAGGRGVPPATTRSVTLILDELLTNTIEHGYRGRPGGRISIEATVHDGAMALRLSDQAPAFDPLQLPPPDTSEDIERRRIGGLGLMFVRRLADELSYRLLDPGGPGQTNELRIVKRFRPSAASAPPA